jgi:hypothetical protein
VSKNRGQIWSEFVIGIALLLVAGFLYVLLNQIMVESIEPAAVLQGVYAPNANLIAFSWTVVLVPVVLVVVYGWINSARKRMGAGWE